jgi:hypothetical protein
MGKKEKEMGKGSRVPEQQKLQDLAHVDLGHGAPPTGELNRVASP